MGKTRYLFKKTRNMKGAFHAKMGLIKDKDGTDLIFSLSEVMEVEVGA